VSSPANGGDTVIHDIGFRHYDGPRLGRSWIVRSLAVDTLRGAFGIGRPAREKIMPWILVGCALIPALVILIVLIAIPGSGLPTSYHEYLIASQLVPALFVASRAPYAVSRDLRDGVMPLYLSRPLTTRDYVAAKFVGLTSAVFFFLVAPITLLFIGALLAKLPVATQLSGYSRAVVIALIAAVLISAIGLAIASRTSRRGFGMAGIITALLMTNGLASLFFEILRNHGDATMAGYMIALNPFGLVDGIAAGLFGLPAGDGPDVPTTVGAGGIFVVIYVLLLGACWWLLARRYRKVAAGA
jgi:ABC-2 type transport system permease protein